MAFDRPGNAVRSRPHPSRASRPRGGRDRTRDACVLSLAVSNLLGSVTPLRIVTDATGLRRIYSATPRTVRISLVRRFGGR